MIGLKSSFPSMSSADLARARSFYVDKLGLPLLMDAAPAAIMVGCGGDSGCLIYAKEDHRPADFTVINFVVEDLEATVDDLAQKGVPMTPPEGMETDDKGIGMGAPGPIAWFKDPDGNWLSMSHGLPDA